MNKNVSHKKRPHKPPWKTEVHNLEEYFTLGPGIHMDSILTQTTHPNTGAGQVI